jgi:tetratricopeptide (TPR) repeat protein
VRNYSFVVYDDGLYITDNQHVRAGLNIENIFWAFSNTCSSNWHPLTWISHMLDVQLYGMNPGSHHMTNVLFHIVNSMLLFIVFKRMTGRIWQSGLIAVLFALHPLHVESVAWVAERKDVLSTFFWMLTMYSYVLYAEYPGIKRYLSVLLFFLLGLMAKPMLVTLPFVLLLLDYWPLRRFQFSQSGDDNINSNRCSDAIKLIYEKTPFFALSVASSIITFLAQKNEGTVGSLESFPIAVRFSNAFVSYVKYIVKLIWPFHLSVFYPHPGKLPGWQVAGACILLIAISLIAIRASKKQPWFAVGWIWYIGTLIPVIGIVQVGLQAMADRYTYVPLIGLFIIIAWGVPELITELHHKWLAFTIVAAIILSTLMAATWLQVGYWANSITLFKHALDVTNNSYLAHNAFGNALTIQGKLDEAVIHYSEAIRIRPIYANAHYNMGHTQAKQGYRREAIEHFRKAIQIKPDYAEAHNYLGYELAHLGKSKEAIEHFHKALQIKPDYAAAHYNLGITLKR